MRRGLVAAVGTALALTGCAAPTDGDGEETFPVAMMARPMSPEATPVVVDTDLGGDDLAALAFLLRSPEIDVEAITIAETGLVGCDPGVDLVADLLTALDEEAVPVACTTTAAGPGAMEFPEEWRDFAATGTGLPRSPGTLTPEPGSASSLVAQLARQHDNLVLVALGPMTTAASLSAAVLGRLAGVHAMGGSVEGEPIDGVAEWNVAADPAAFGTVLAAGVPLTIVPEDAVPDGTPDVLNSVPGVAQVAATAGIPTWWDLATAAALVIDPESSTGEWVLDGDVPGRLVREGDGDVQVVRALDADALEAAYAEALG